MGKWENSVRRIVEYYDNQHGKMTLGCDGFIDDVKHVIKEWVSPDEYRPYEKVEDYARAILARGAGGMSFGLAQKRRTYGGFSCNTGKAAGRLGGNLTLLGMFGIEEIDPVFSEFMENYNTISVGDPAVSMIYEFTDGKIFYGGTSPRKPTQRTWEQLVGAMGLDGLRSAFADADVVGFGYYGNKVYFDDIIKNLYENFLIDGRCTRLFFDFGNIQHSSKEQLISTFELLTPYNIKVPITLSLNEHEGKVLFSFYGRDFTWDTPLPGVEEDIAYVREQVNWDEIIIHTPFFAVGASASEGTALVKQRRAAETVITTGAGDNFNGGYLSTHVQKGKLNLEERLFVANAVTGAYVRSGLSPDKTALEIEMNKLMKVVD